MPAPLEVYTAPFNVYLAPVGTAFPALAAAPSGSFFKLGAGGFLNYDEDGINVSHEQGIEEWRSLGSTLPIKPFRGEESIKFSLGLVDTTAEHYAKVLNDAAVTTVAAGAGVIGHRKFQLEQGPIVATYALLMRANSSPYSDTLPAQYQAQIVYQSASPELTYAKDAPAMLEVEFSVLKPATGLAAELLLGNAPAS